MNIVFTVCRKPIMKRLILSVCFGFIAVCASTAGAQNAIPTLVPPTPIASTPTPPPDGLQTVSGLAQIQSDGVLRVGILMNEPPFGQLDVLGQVSGYDADLARAIAEAWDVSLELIQVTRLNALQSLNNNEVDLLIAAQVHKRELDRYVEFSHTYRMSRQSLMVRADDPAVLLINMVGRRIGYVLGTESEAAAVSWLNDSGQGVTGQAFLTLDQAYRALFANEIDGLIGRHEHLLRVSAGQADAVKFLNEPIVLEPFAIAMPRQDVNLRQLVNRTLQYLQAEDTLEVLHRQYFPGEPYQNSIIPLWERADENVPPVTELNSEIRYPEQYVVPRLQSDRTLRVAGLADPPTDAPESERRTFLFHQRVLNELASRWDVGLELVSGDVLSLIESGQADIGVGVSPDWALSDRLDFSQAYLMHGDRMLIPANRDIDGFGDLRNRWVGIIAGDGDAEARVRFWVDSISGRVNIFTVNFEQNAATVILDSQNADVIFGDSLRLIPHLDQNPGQLELTDRWYTRRYKAFALPRNDIDFRLLVDYTLQEMQQDGTLPGLMTGVFPPDEVPPLFDYWPGPSTYLGLSLSS